MISIGTCAFSSGLGNLRCLDGFTACRLVGARHRVKLELDGRDLGGVDDDGGGGHLARG